LPVNLGVRFSHRTDDMSTTKVGDELEHRIFELIEKEFENDSFPIKKANCKFFKKKGYYSKDREREIIFDVSVEVYCAGSKDYSFLILVECKNYKSPVKVEEVEEFFAKAQQVAAANSKAVVATSSSFQSGARTFAKSKGIALLRYFDPENHQLVLHRSPSTSVYGTGAESLAEAEEALSQEAFKSRFFDIYFQSTSRVTNSLFEFAEDVANEAGFTRAQIRRAFNTPKKSVGVVPYLEKSELEERSQELLDLIGYSEKEVPLNSICALEKERTGLVVKINEPPNPGCPLGEISFSPLQIIIYQSDEQNTGRDRFTLAHELAHHFLGHGKHMVKDAFNEEDLSLNRTILQGSAIARLEFQANYFASSLLMPRANFIKDFQTLASHLGLVNRGYGALYVDDQPCNIQNFKIITNNLMRQYSVSRKAVAVRLESLDLLKDQRSGAIFGANN